MKSDTIHKYEKAVVFVLNLDGWDLEWTGENYEHYDAKGKTPKGHDCVIEMKFRNKYYEDKLLEKYKYDKNYTQASKDKKLFIYVTEYKTRIIAWNITDLTINGYNFNWETRQQPETTEFYLQEPIPKRVGYLLEQFGKILR